MIQTAIYFMMAFVSIVGMVLMVMAYKALSACLI